MTVLFELNLFKKLKFWIERSHYFCSKSLANLESKMNFQTKYNKKWPCEKSLIMNLPLNWFWFQLCFYNPQDWLKNYYIIDIHGHEPGLRPTVYVLGPYFYGRQAGCRHWLSMPVAEIGSLSFYSCHLELVISKNIWVFAFYFER